MNNQQAQAHAAGAALQDRQIWIFDLDNTLYPAESNLFAQIDQRMGTFIAQYLDLPLEQARKVQKHYYRQYGTTLSGLMQVHGLNPHDFLEFVHDIDLTPVPAMPELAAAIEKLPGRKLIYTNGSRHHAERVADKLGVLHLFEDITDIVASHFIAKPHEAAYLAMIAAQNVAPHEAVMFEDMPHNLQVPHDLGMATVLVHSGHVDHPVQAHIDEWRRPPDYVHHMTEDLTMFLTGLSEKD